MVTFCVLKKQSFLNQGDFVSPASIVINVELDDAGYFNSSKVIITDNYSSKVILNLDVETEERYRNTEHMLNVLADDLERVRKNLNILREDYVKVQEERKKSKESKETLA